MLLDAVVARVLDDALAHAERKVEPAMRGIALLEVLDDAQRMKIVVEAATMPLEALVQRALAGVAKRRMADVVNQRQRLRQILVQAKRRGDGAGDLRDLNGVGQPAAKVVGGAAGKDLRLARQPAKGARLHDAFPVALKGRARSDGTARDRRGSAGGSSASPATAQRCRSIAIVRFKCNGRDVTASVVRRSGSLLSCLGVSADLGQLHPRVFQLVLHLGDVGRIGIGRQRVRILGHRPLPLRDRHLQLAGLLVDLAQMIVDGGVRCLRSFALRRFSSARAY